MKIDTDRTFAGQLAEDFGLLDYNARYYDPTLGRFISADTIVPGPGSPLAWDRYAYTGNNPIRYTDPTGKFACDEVTVGGRCLQPYHDHNPIPDFLDTIIPPVDASTTTLFGSRNTMNAAIPEWNNIKIDGITPDELRAFMANYGLHAGVDIAGGRGASILAIYDGVVVDVISNQNANGGNRVVMAHFLSGSIVYSFYYHMQDQYVEEGDVIQQGEEIGTVGDSGSPGSYHLHFEVRTTTGAWQDPSAGKYTDFPNAGSSWWANSLQELNTSWIDISRRFGGYSSMITDTLGWK